MWYKGTADTERKPVTEKLMIMSIPPLNAEPTKNVAWRGVVTNLARRGAAASTKKYVRYIN